MKLTVTLYHCQLLHKMLLSVMLPRKCMKISCIIAAVLQDRRTSSYVLQQLRHQRWWISGSVTPARLSISPGILSWITSQTLFMHVMLQQNCKASCKNAYLPIVTVPLACIVSQMSFHSVFSTVLFWLCYMFKAIGTKRWTENCRKWVTDFY